MLLKNPSGKSFLKLQGALIRNQKYRVWLKPDCNYNLIPLAEANGNEKNIFLSLPSHLCDGPVKKLALALAKQIAITDNDLFGTVQV